MSAGRSLDEHVVSGAPSLPLSVRSLLLRELRSVRAELEAYPDETAIWALPPGLPNSGGTLALHIAGNLRHYVGAVLGGSGYVRDRAREFTARGVSRRELLDEITAAEDVIGSTFPHLSDADLPGTFPEPIRDHWIPTGEMLLQLAVHLAYHLGQLSYHRRVVTGESGGVGALPAGELRGARAAGERTPPSTVEERG
ncbi:MAG TPA: DinB family protein [Longimicrobiaceae bacterium]|nr:DinB family protein [Longimicrobiaceae bacterium]